MKGLKTVDFSPLKRNILLVLIRDMDTADLIESIKLYLSVTSEQVFYIIDYLLEHNWIFFEDGKLILSSNGYNSLREANLEDFSLNRIDEWKFKIDQKHLQNYIPKNF